MVEVILYGKSYLAKPLTRPRARSKSFTGENYSGVLSPKYSSPTYSFFRTTYVATKRNNQKKGSQAVYPLELKKAVEAIFIRPMQGSKITLVMRKAYNVLLQRAQEQGQEVVTYRVPLSEIIRDIHYDSHDYELLKQYLRRLNATQVEWDLLTEGGKKRWGVSTMLSEAEIVDRHLEFSFAPKIKKRLLDPAIYHRIDLRLQTRFRSKPVEKNLTCELTPFPHVLFVSSSVIEADFISCHSCFLRLNYARQVVSWGVMHIMQHR